jgi:hypothetical protein
MQTEVYPTSQHPAWGEQLTVTYLEQELADEQLLVAVVQAGTNKLLLKAAVPLGPMVPEQLYHLQVQLSPEAVLYLSCRLVTSEQYQLQRLQGLRMPDAAAIAKAAAEDKAAAAGKAGAGKAPAAAAAAAGGDRPQGAMVQLEVQDLQPVLQVLCTAAHAAAPKPAAPTAPPSGKGAAAKAAAAAAAAATQAAAVAAAAMVSEIWLVCSSGTSGPSNGSPAADVLQGRKLHATMGQDVASATAAVRAQAQRYLGPNALQALPLCCSIGRFGFDFKERVSRLSW